MNTNILATSVLRWAAVTAVTTLLIGSTSHSPVMAATNCRHSNKVSSSTKIGSQVDGNLVTICLSKSLLKVLRPKPKPLPKVSVKPAPKQAPKATPIGVPPRLSVTKPPPRKPRPAPSKPKIKNRNRGNSGVFTARVDSLSASPSVVKPNTTVTVKTAQTVKFGRTKLLGNPVVVRFTPVSLDFAFGDAATKQVSGTTAHLTHAYSQIGQYQLTVKVRFKVEYRLKNGSWFTDPDTITLAPAEVTIKVQDGKSPPSNSNVVLVTPSG